ncbi:capsule assembly Wzi family protein [Larkinella humicola]|uniref:Capsule assembly Wzi family protein n=1 Tax=Larkinella humicola TaxID=2607654 RepID=A0A5N1J9X4_9BACT|nr:capsule assembly Wzi family protein [Larkinella humicola]KAA9349472.1 capsule assembly Wzi family protein [Larkinella humicola]
MIDFIRACRMPFLLLLGLIPFKDWAQTVDSTSSGITTEIYRPDLEKKEFRLFVETAFSANTAPQTPFWLRANQYGTVPATSPFGTLRGGMAANYLYDRTKPANLIKNKRRLIGWGYGLEVVGNASRKSAVLIPEAYVKGRLWGLELLVGRRKEVIGLADSTLGTGPYIGSGNAMPLPRVQLALAEYTPVGFTKGVISFRGLYAHGWFGNQGAVTHSYLHQKALYGRLGKPGWPVRFYAGFNHQVQWAGRSEVVTNENQIKNGRFPTGFRNYLNAVTGTSLAARGDNIDTTLFSKADRGNRLGNHLGTLDIGFEISTKRFSLLLYRQSIYDDGSLFYLTNIADGLHGIRFKNNRPASYRFQIQTVLVEYLNTQSQGGAKFGDLNKERGADNYFNHTQYIDGWSYLGRTIGTPFIPPVDDTRSELPRAQTIKNYLFSNNNRVQVFHVGMSGTWSQRYLFQLKCSMSQNLGTYAQPFSTTLGQFSSLLVVGFPAFKRGMQARVSVASDHGALYPNSTGFQVSLRKTWDVSRP